MKMIDLFNSKKVNFVSVTQHFSTTDPTGRMLLGVLITFAQYEREVIGERIRDKIGAAKRRGKFCGGTPILGYDIDHEHKKLIINREERPIVIEVFKRYSQLGGAKEVARELNQKGITTKSWTTKNGITRSGTRWNTGHIYRLLKNRLYIGEIEHKGNIYPAEHEAIVDRELWDTALPPTINTIYK